MMLADRETGILMKFEGYKNGKVSGCINVTKCVIDGETEIKRFDEKQYSSYNSPLTMSLSYSNYSDICCALILDLPLGATKEVFIVYVPIM